MSQENVELVRSLYMAWERGDFGSVEWMHPEIEYVSADGPDPGSWTSVAGIAEAFRVLVGPFEEFRVEADSFREVDDERVLVDIYWSARGKTSGLEMEQLREGVEQSKYGGIIVAYLSRLGRNVREQLQVWDRVEAAGGRIIVVRERIDTSTPSGRYIRTILAANDERELEEYTERFERLREWATATGIWQQRQTPRGYLKDPATRKLVPDAHAEQIRQTFRNRGAGETISSLARNLGMTQSGARALLRNRVYLGELRLGKYVNRTAHEPLVTEEEWLAAQRLRSSRPGRTEEFPALLAGLVRCASCGHIMSRSPGGRSGGTYACHVQHSGGRCIRPVGITHGRLDHNVEQIALAELANLKPTAAKNDRDITAAQHTLIQAERELAAYLERVSAADLAPRQYAEGARQRREAVEWTTTTGSAPTAPWTCIAPDPIGELVPLPRTRPRTVRRRDRLGGLLHEYELAA